MGITTVFDMTEFLHIEDGTVIGPCWTDDRCRELLRSLRKLNVSAPDSPEGAECPGDVEIAARIFHEVLSLRESASIWPVFSAGRPRDSLFKAAVLHAIDDSDLVALLRLSDESAVLAANVARWMLRMKQQSDTRLVFTQPPPARFLSRPRRPERSDPKLLVAS